MGNGLENKGWRTNGIMGFLGHFLFFFPLQLWQWVVVLMAGRQEPTLLFLCTFPVLSCLVFPLPPSRKMAEALHEKQEKRDLLFPFPVLPSPFIWSLSPLLFLPASGFSCFSFGDKVSAPQNHIILPWSLVLCWSLMNSYAWMLAQKSKRWKLIKFQTKVMYRPDKTWKRWKL